MDHSWKQYGNPIFMDIANSLPWIEYGNTVDVDIIETSNLIISTLCISTFFRRLQSRVTLKCPLCLTKYYSLFENRMKSLAGATIKKNFQYRMYTAFR